MILFFGGFFVTLNFCKIQILTYFFSDMFYHLLIIRHTLYYHLSIPVFVLGQSTPNTNSRQKRSGNRNYERKFDPKEIEKVSLYFLLITQLNLFNTSFIYYSLVHVTHSCNSFSILFRVSPFQMKTQLNRNMLTECSCILMERKQR